jgi:hypothetical protein
MTNAKCSYSRLAPPMPIVRLAATMTKERTRMLVLDERHPRAAEGGELTART